MSRGRKALVCFKDGIMAHEHGPHKCYCPTCNAEIEVGAYVKCNTLTCAQCGTRMRAKETGEYRVATKEESMPNTIATENIPCAICHYPTPAPSYVGQLVKCVYCGSINEAIADVTIPTPVFVGFLCFGLGVLFGPALLATTAGGQSWMQ